MLKGASGGAPAPAPADAPLVEDSAGPARAPVGAAPAPAPAPSDSRLEVLPVAKAAKDTQAALAMLYLIGVTAGRAEDAAALIVSSIASGAASNLVQLSGTYAVSVELVLEIRLKIACLQYNLHLCVPPLQT